MDHQPRELVQRSLGKFPEAARILRQRRQPSSSLYPQYDLYSVGVNYNGVPGALISQIGNKDLTWERTFTPRAESASTPTSSTTVCASTSTGTTRTPTTLSTQCPSPYLVGVTSIYRNIGKMRNRGIELTIGGEIIATRDWTWSLEANLTTNKTSSATSTSRKKPTAQWWSSP